MDLLVFVLASLMVFSGAVGVIACRHPVHAALSLVLTLFGVAVYFVSMEAQFLAVVQVIVYAGAIVVLFLFVIMLLGVDTAEDLRVEPLTVQRPLAIIASLSIIGLVLAGIVAARDVPPLQGGVGLEVDAATPTGNTDGNIKQLADNLFGAHVLAFELTSVLLIVAVAGTVVLTRKDRRRPKESQS